jgi:hypothetical protein
MGAGDDAVESIAEALRRYVAAHPAAADSLEGVQRWWLPAELGPRAPAAVEWALAQLAKEGVVVQRRLPDGRVLYAARGT